MTLTGADAPLVSVVVVSWNVRDLLRACLRSIVDDEHARRCEVIVIDNASADGSAEMVESEFPAVQLIRNASNRGFTAANNQGALAARGQHLFFLNPDAEVHPGAIGALVGFLEEHQAAGAVGPRLRYGDGSPQPSRRRFPTPATALMESSPVAWHWPDNPWSRRLHMADLPAEDCQPVDWLVGAALMVRAVAFLQTGGFDEGFFMYSEETDLCYRLRTLGWEIVYVPEAVVTHHEARSSDQAVASRHVNFQTSKLRYHRKTSGPLTAAALRFTLLGMFAVEWSLEGAKWMAGSKRDLRRQRLEAYAAVLRSGLRERR
jgi:hypothetical protein